MPVLYDESKVGQPFSHRSVHGGKTVQERPAINELLLERTLRLDALPAGPYALNATPEIRAMPGQQYSIRRMMAFTAIFALFALLVSSAMRGNSVAMAVAWVTTLAVASLVAFAILFIMASVIAGGFRHLIRPGRQSADQSPFAEHRPPPQMVRPEEPI